jgi:hypothetical protein
MFQGFFLCPMHMIFALGMTMILLTISGGESYAENQS